jgi:hypothetical protein
MGDPNHIRCLPTSRLVRAIAIDEAMTLAEALRGITTEPDSKSKRYAAECAAELDARIRASEVPHG